MAMYTAIDHEIQRELELTCNEYCVAHLIHIWSYNPKNSNGWCYATKETIAFALYISKGTTLSIIEKLIDKGIVEKHPITKHLRTTPFWYDKVENSGTVSIPTVQKTTNDSTDIAPKSGTVSVPNNDILLIDKINSKETISLPAEINIKPLPTVLDNTNTLFLTGTPQMEIETPEKKAFNEFVIKIIERAPLIMKMKEPLTFSQYLSLCKLYRQGVPGYSTEDILERFEKIHNSPKAIKNRSAYLTLKNWTKQNW